MTNVTLSAHAEPWRSRLNPRRSLAAAIGWTIAAVSLLGAISLSVWLGLLTRARTEEQIGAIFQQYATQISNELDINLYAKLQSIQTVATVLGATSILKQPQQSQRLLDEFRVTLPELQWIGFADMTGRVTVSSGAGPAPADVLNQTWFIRGRKGPQVGDVDRRDALRAFADANSSETISSFIDLSAPVFDAQGRMTGVVGAQLSWAWAKALETSLTHTLRARRAVQTLLVDREGAVVLGPAELVGKPFGVDDTGALLRVQRMEKASGAPAPSGQTVAVWPDGLTYIAGYAVSDGFGSFPGLGWVVWVREPAEIAFAYSRVQQRRVFGAVLLLGLLSAVASVAAAQRLVRGLADIARSADQIRYGQRTSLDVPRGPHENEVTRIGRSLQQLLDEVQSRTAALERLNAELDARVAARTREVERMAEENRHAAVVRERLRLARDLHDTLAHSIMGLLTEIRLMRKLADNAPQALPAELARAEEAARTGLREARAAIGQLRRNAVLDVGLGAALRELLHRFSARDGLRAEFHASSDAEALADSRAEVVYRIVEEALRNIERHAHAQAILIGLHISELPHDGRQLVLRIVDDGVGFDESQVNANNHFGLRGMREQAELIGAQIDIHSVPGEGTRIEVSAPL